MMSSVRVGSTSRATSERKYSGSVKQSQRVRVMMRMTTTLMVMMVTMIVMWTWMATYEV